MKCIAMLLIMFSIACKPICNEVPPKHIFNIGDMAIFNATKEKVEIIKEWHRVNGRCNYDFPIGQYTIRFKDRSEITAMWNLLTPINKTHSKDN